MNHRHLLGIFTLSLSLVGCAAISGFQTYNLPKEGIYQTELGTPVNLVQLNQQTLPVVQSAQTNNLNHLCNFISDRGAGLSLESR